MSTEVSFEMTLQDLRVIIHGLRMSSFSFVEEKALTEINAMIKALPGPVQINTMQPGDVKSLQDSIGKIMRLIEVYGKKDMEYKTRYKARTGLPPRYKVLDWRCNMSQKARNLTRVMVKTSAVVDDLGYFDIADRLVKCAKKMQSNEIDEIELAKITADTLNKMGFIKEASDLRKMAQTIELGVEDIMGGVQQLYGVVDSVLGMIYKKVDTLRDIPTAKNAIQSLYKLWQNIQGFKQNIGKPFEALKQQAPVLEQALESVVPKSVFDANEKKNYEIEWTEQDASGEQTAYVTKADGQKYEVQRDEKGKMSVAQTPMAVSVPQAQTEIAQPQTQPQPESNIQQPSSVQQQEFNPGTQVTWTSNKGKQQKGVVKGPGAKQEDIVVKYDGGEIAIPKAKVQIDKSSPGQAVPETTTRREMPQTSTHQSEFEKGTQVMWTTNRGAEQRGVVRGPAANPQDVVVEYQGKTLAVPKNKLKVAAFKNVFNLMKYAGK